MILLFRPPVVLLMRSSDSSLGIISRFIKISFPIFQERHVATVIKRINPIVMKATAKNYFYHFEMKVAGIQM